MTVFVSPIVLIHGISLFIMVIMLLQFWRIHHKRLTLLATFVENGELEERLHSERVQRLVLMLLYAGVTIGITVISSWLFFIRPDFL